MASHQPFVAGQNDLDGGDRSFDLALSCACQVHDGCAFEKAIQGLRLSYFGTSYERGPSMLLDCRIRLLKLLLLSGSMIG